MVRLYNELHVHQSAYSAVKQKRIENYKPAAAVEDETCSSFTELCDWMTQLCSQNLAQLRCFYNVTMGAGRRTPVCCHRDGVNLCMSILFFFGLYWAMCKGASYFMPTPDISKWRAWMMCFFFLFILLRLGKLSVMDLLHSTECLTGSHELRHFEFFFFYILTFLSKISPDVDLMLYIVLYSILYWDIYLLRCYFSQL